MAKNKIIGGKENSVKTVYAEIWWKWRNSPFSSTYYNAHKNSIKTLKKLLRI